MSGVGITVQEDPFHCSAMMTGFCWVAPSWAPTAQQSDAVTQLTLHNREACEPDGWTLGPMDQAVPFQWSAMALGCGLLLLPLPAGITPPTAQQFQALVQVVPIRML